MIFTFEILSATRRTILSADRQRCANASEACPLQPMQVFRERAVLASKYVLPLPGMYNNMTLISFLASTERAYKEMVSTVEILSATRCAIPSADRQRHASASEVCPFQPVHVCRERSMIASKYVFPFRVVRKKEPSTYYDGNEIGLRPPPLNLNVDVELSVLAVRKKEPSVLVAACGACPANIEI